MQSANEAYGDGTYTGISSNYQLRARTARMRSFVASGAGLKVLLPDARTLKVGGPQFYILNLGLQSFDVADFSGNSLITINVNELTFVHLLANTTSAGSWGVSGRVFYGGPNNTTKLAFGNCIAQSVFAGDVKKLSVLTAAGNLQVITVFTGNVTEPSDRFAAGAMIVATVFVGNAAVFPTAKIVSPSASGSGTGSFADPWTLKQAGQNTVAGDTVSLRGGVYADAVNNVLDSINTTVVSGSSGNVITYQNYPGEIPEIRGVNRLPNCQYLTFKRLKFVSSGKRMVTTGTSGGTHRNLEFDGCEFEAQPFTPGGAGTAFTALTFQNGRDYAFRNCKFGKWYGGDFLAFVDAEHIIVENCDFSQSGAPHMLLGFLDCGYAYTRNSIFRNEWGRVTRIGRRAGSTRKYALIEDCVFSDSNWNRVDFHPGSGEPGSLPGDTESVRYQQDGAIFRNNIIVGHNAGQSQGSGGAPFSYSCGFETHFFDNYTDIKDIRVYNNVVHKSDRCAVSFLYNTSAGTVLATGYKFKNNNITTFVLYGLNITSTTLPWESWLFQANRVYDPSKTKTIFIHAEGAQLFTVTEAQAQNSAVFKDNVSSVPGYVNAALFDTFDADPSLCTIDDLPSLFSAFAETSPVAGKELATVTANGTTVTTISVDDSGWFFPTTDYYGGDKVIIGTDVCTVTSIPSATSIVVTPAITVAIGDKVYIERMTTAPPIGIVPLLSRAVTGTGGTLNVGVVMTAVVKGDHAGSGALIVATAFTGSGTVESGILVQFNFEGNNLSEFTTLVNSADLAVQGSAALKGSYGMQVTIDTSEAAFGEKDISWSTQYLRYRCYVDPNTITMVNGDEFYIVEFRTAGGQSSGYLRLGKTSGSYRVRAGQRQDDGTYLTTAQWTISDASHYVEVEFKRSANDTSNDAETKLWIDGTLQETVSGGDVSAVGRPTRCLFGATTSIELTTVGTIYLDALVVKNVTGTIGA